MHGDLRHSRWFAYLKLRLKSNFLIENMTTMFVNPFCFNIWARDHQEAWEGGGRFNLAGPGSPLLVCTWAPYFICFVCLHFHLTFLLEKMFHCFKKFERHWFRLEGSSPNTGGPGNLFSSDTGLSTYFCPPAKTSNLPAAPESATTPFRPQHVDT